MNTAHIIGAIKRALGIQTPAPEPGVYYEDNADGNGKLTVVIRGEGVGVEKAVNFGDDLVNAEIVGIGYVERTDDGEIEERWISEIDLPPRGPDDGVEVDR